MLEKLVDKLMKIGAAAAETQANRVIQENSAKANATAGGGVAPMAAPSPFPQSWNCDGKTPISIVCERIVIKPGVPGANGIAMDGAWRSGVATR